MKLVVTPPPRSPNDHGPDGQFVVADRWPSAEHHALANKAAVMRRYGIQTEDEYAALVQAGVIRVNNFDLPPAMPTLPPNDAMPTLVDLHPVRRSK